MKTLMHIAEIPESGVYVILEGHLVRLFFDFTDPVVPEGEESYPEDLKACESIDVEGNAFLHNMVRIMVGSLVEVGRHNRPVTWVEQALELRDRRAAGPTAPPTGLVLRDVCYPKDMLLSWE